MLLEPKFHDMLNWGILVRIIFFFVVDNVRNVKMWKMSSSPAAIFFSSFFKILFLFFCLVSRDVFNRPSWRMHSCQEYFIGIFENGVDGVAQRCRLPPSHGSDAGPRDEVTISPPFWRWNQGDIVEIDIKVTFSYCTCWMAAKRKTDWWPTSQIEVNVDLTKDFTVDSVSNNVFAALSNYFNIYRSVFPLELWLNASTSLFETTWLD